MQELKLEELSVKQKLGMVLTGNIRLADGDKALEENAEYVYDLIRNRSLGAIWVNPGIYKFDEIMSKIKELADYPILILTDAESGIGDYLIGKHNALGCTGDEKHAYAFGKLTGITARKMGYNVVCNPVVDMKAGSVRSLGTDKYQVTKLAKAEARGMHDGGVLTVVKHYAGGDNPDEVDSHMGESYTLQTKEELLEDSLYPYIELMKEGLMDGTMTGHKKYKSIDPDMPCSLSEKMISIIREQGFDGFLVTDALCMMSIRAKYGEIESKGLAIKAGNDLALPFNIRVKENYEALVKCYEMGIITDERLDEAVRRVLEAQHKVTLLPTDAEITEEDIDIFNSINKDGIYARTDEGLDVAISKDGNHYFAVMVRNESNTSFEDGKPMVDTFSNGWLYPQKVVAQLKENFPNSTVKLFYQFPEQEQNVRILEDSIDCDDVIFFTFTEPLAYTGKEHITRRVETLISAMQLTNRISTIVHYGNPYVLENLPHISRHILGGLSAGSVEASIDVLAGKYPAKGVLTCDVKLN